MAYIFNMRNGTFSEDEPELAEENKDLTYENTYKQWVLEFKNGAKGFVLKTFLSTH